MSLTFYLSTPGVEVERISTDSSNIRFSGKDTRIIHIDGLSYGGTLFLEDFPSLEEIHVKSPGVGISFNKFPNNTIRVFGVFEEISINHDEQFLTLNRHIAIDYNLMQASVPTMWGAIITRDSKEPRGKMDALMLYTEDAENVVIPDGYSNVSILGSKNLQHIETSGTHEISKITIQDAENLQSVNIRKRVVYCSIKECQSISHVRGFGEFLKLDSISSKSRSLTIGGYWQEVPPWYKEIHGQLDLPNLDPEISLDDIKTCNDLSGVRFVVDPYDDSGAGLLFDRIPDVDFSFGVEIPVLLDLLSRSKSSRELTAFSQWCEGELGFKEQYLGMRIAAALIYRGVMPQEIIKIRNSIFCSNRNRWYSHSKMNQYGWSKPMDSVIPFHYVDLEIWLNTDLSTEFIGLEKEESTLTSRSRFNPFGNVNTTRTPHKNRSIRDLLNSSLMAVKSNDRPEKAEAKLVYLIDEIFSNKLILSDSVCVQFLVKNYDFTRSVHPNLVENMVNTILEIDVDASTKAAILFALIEINNSTKARVALRKIKSSEGISLKEARAIDTVSLLGKKAFDAGKVTRPVWPYIKNWRIEYKNKEE